MQLHIENMTCGGCVRTITGVVQAIDANAHLSADLDQRTVQLESQAPVEQITRALQEAGFAVTVQ